MADDRSVTIKMPASHEERGGGSVREHCPSVDGGGACDDNWGDDTTAVTGNTSETGWSSEDVRLTREVEQTVGFRCCSRRSGGAACIVSGLLVAVAYVSPIIMVVLPALYVVPFQCPAAVTAAVGGGSDHTTVVVATAPPAATDCGQLSPLSEGMLIGFAARLLALAAGVWALFCRHPRSSLPRVHAHRALVLFVLFVLTLTYWLFYGYRALSPAAGGRHSALSYDECVHYASSMVDALLFVHYAAVVLMELRHLQPAFCVKLLRSPDGLCRTYHIGRLSVQRAAEECLECYYRDFAAYNPYLENAMRRRAVSHSGSSASQGTKFKVYDVDGSGAAAATAVIGAGEGSQRSKAILAAEARRRDASHNERFYQESEYERRVHKRRARLITAAEEAFTHVKRYKEDGGPASPMDCQEAAQAIFPSMARSLQKYLRVTRQQPWHTMESILDHLADCLQSDASARAFLEPYLAPGSAVVHNPKECVDGELWSLACDGHPGRSVAQGTQFTLRKGEVSLLCVVKRLPFFTLVEEPSRPGPKGGKFVLRLNSETSV